MSWNIQHLHGETRIGRVEKIAEYMLAFRCDFWALQEVGADGVRELVDAMNANGDLVYAYTIAKDEHGEEAEGQQSACVYRTDTVRVRELSAPDFFGNKIKVTYKDGSKKTKGRISATAVAVRRTRQAKQQQGIRFSLRGGASEVDRSQDRRLR